MPQNGQIGLAWEAAATKTIFQEGYLANYEPNLAYFHFSTRRMTQLKQLDPNTAELEGRGCRGTVTGDTASLGRTEARELLALWRPEYGDSDRDVVRPRDGGKGTAN